MTLTRIIDRARDVSTGSVNTPENTDFLPGTMGRTDGLSDDMGG